MSTKKSTSRKCRCGKPGTYRYSYELAVWLNKLPWAGVFLCNKCMVEIDQEWLEKRVSDVGKNK